MDTEIGVITLGYIVYLIGLNWMYIKEYIKGNDKGVIRRGNEWGD
jgi:hypothetical protein